MSLCVGEGEVIKLMFSSTAPVIFAASGGQKVAAVRLHSKFPTAQQNEFSIEETENQVSDLWQCIHANAAKGTNWIDYDYSLPFCHSINTYKTWSLHLDCLVVKTYCTCSTYGLASDNSYWCSHLIGIHCNVYVDKHLPCCKCKKQCLALSADLLVVHLFLGGH